MLHDVTAAALTRGALPSARGRCPSFRRFRFRSGVATSASARSRSGRMEARVAEVAARLREVTALGPDRATPKVSPLWWAELEIMSASDT